ncbi:MAG: FtsW/RodA/SpoVE family cell cycle protein [Paludibacteraceae bacterium]|nr:FtsW/RodA/SpoVE family cell cycle protein [Paludibacteraceae bacterium]
MKELIRKIFKGDAILWTIIILLFIVSGMVMFSAISSSAYRHDDYLSPFWGHLKHLCFAFVIILVVHQFPFRSIRLGLWFIPLLSLILLILTSFMGKDVNNASRSIVIAGFEIQSIEITKVAIVILFSEILGYFNTHKEKKMTIKPFCIMSCILVLFCFLVMIQNFSTAFLLFGVTILMMYIGRVSLKYIVSLIGIIVLVGGLFIGGSYAFNIENKITKRVDTWVSRLVQHNESTANQSSNKTIVIDDSNRQIINSKIAIANGISPCGPGNSIQRDYLALAFSDFVYAVMIEEYGIFFGGICVILLYVIILARTGKIARRCGPNEATESLLVIGLGLIIVLQAFINMSVATELGPVTGQTLPLISRGGMSLLVTAFCFGLILGISAHNEERIKKEQAALLAKEDTNNTPIEPTDHTTTINQE